MPDSVEMPAPDSTSAPAARTMSATAATPSRATARLPEQVPLCPGRSPAARPGTHRHANMLPRARMPCQTRVDRARRPLLYSAAHDPPTGRRATGPARAGRGADHAAPASGRRTHEEGFMTETRTIRAWRRLMLALAALFALATASAQVELRVTWYDDGNEGQVLRDLLDRFEAENPDIR